MLGVESYKKQHKEAWKKDWKGFVVVGLFTGVNVALNNSSLVYISLSMNQVITATMPVLTCLFAVLLEDNYRPNQYQIYGIIPICIGVIIVVYEESNNETIGIFLCAGATLANALRTAMSSKVLTGKLDVLSMTWYTGPISALVLMPIALAKEWTPLMTYLSEKFVDGTGILLGGSCLALIYNIVLFMTIKTLTGVTMNVMGNVKIILLLFLSRVVLGELSDVDVQMVSGIVLTFGGFFLYSYGTFMKAKAPPPVSSVKSGA
eukprot:CAMPEP_0197846864 /NCGR_PEP_ID=MMETSP1438-20131217/4667_1 /TAXON_ID=1461541 /ORGANISM="Pterosperma sp., Strain CCMP1384" /LENGTH=261 /DNA_ID=CAMNT_0043458641 /DNA_START=391 /DNA_END=1176 /DNA_ORIENTATION=+